MFSGRDRAAAMSATTITVTGIIDTFFLLLVGVGPKLAFMPYLKITAPLESTSRHRVVRRMLATAATAALALIVLGELLSRIFHFTVQSLSIAGGAILLVLAVRMVVDDAPADARIAGTPDDPMRLASVPLAVPYLLNPVGFVALVTLSAEADSLTVVAVEVGILAVVLGLDALVFVGAGFLSSRFDEGRAVVIEKIFGVLIAAIAVQLVLDGLGSAHL